MSKIQYSLLLDFGASRIKSVAVNLETGIYSHSKSESALQRELSNSQGDSAGHFEISASGLIQKFRSICNYYLNDLNLSLDRIMICSEMHGFIITDEDYNPVSNYISWKDQRSLEQLQGVSTFDRVNIELASQYKEITGMRLRASLPFVNFLHIAKIQKIPKKCFILSLPEWLIIGSEEGVARKKGDSVVHESIMAGLGIYDLQRRAASNILKDYIKEFTGNEIRFQSSCEKIQVAGSYKTGKDAVPIFTGVGDHACAVLGAGNILRKSISVNIGTGSQVAIVEHIASFQEAEYRPYFDGNRMCTITHIPAGRALNAYINFLNNILKFAGSPEFNFWNVLQSLTLKEIESSKLRIDLSLFPGSWNYKSGGSIGDILESNWDVRNYLASLVYSLSCQYSEVIRCLDPMNEVPKILLSGGIPQLLPVLKELLSLSSIRVVQGSGTSLDETLVGLRHLAMQAANPVLSLQECQK